MLFKHIQEKIMSMPTSGLSKDTVIKLAKAFRDKDFSSYRKNLEFDTIGILEVGNHISIHIKVDRKDEIAVADFMYDNYYLTTEVYMYTRNFTFLPILKEDENKWYDMFVDVLLNDLERAVVKGIYDLTITEEEFLERG
jgi:hypothetical protein